MLDEVSTLGGALLYKIDEALGHLRASPMPFGGVPVILFTSDFFQFVPVLQKTILFPCDSRVSCLPLMGPGSYQQDGSNDGRIRYDDDLRVITFLNRHCWDPNSQAVMMWAKRLAKKVSIFISNHEWSTAWPSDEEMVRALEQGDDKDCLISAIFVYADGIPIMINENVYLGLKVANGNIFQAAGIIPDRQHRPVRLSIVFPDVQDPAIHTSEIDVNLHFGPPSSIILVSKSTVDFAFLGKSSGTIMMFSKKITMARTQRNTLRMWY